MCVVHDLVHERKTFTLNIFIKNTQLLNSYFSYICPFLFCKKYIDGKEINNLVK